MKFYDRTKELDMFSRISIATAKLRWRKRWTICFPSRHSWSRWISPLVVSLWRICKCPIYMWLVGGYAYQFCPAGASSVPMMGKHLAPVGQNWCQTDAPKLHFLSSANHPDNSKHPSGREQSVRQCVTAKIWRSDSFDCFLKYHIYGELGVNSHPPNQPHPWT